MLYVELLDCLPALAVQTTTAGKFWLHTTAPLPKDRLVLKKWVERLTMPEVHARLNFCFQQKNMQWHPLITPFRQALCDFYSALYTRNEERRTAKEMQSAAEGCMKDDAVCCTASSQGPCGDGGGTGGEKLSSKHNQGGLEGHGKAKVIEKRKCPTSDFLKSGHFSPHSHQRGTQLQMVAVRQRSTEYNAVVSLPLKKNCSSHCISQGNYIIRIQRRCGGQDIHRR